MYIQKSDICSIENLLQGHVKQTDMLIILGDFTGLSQNKGIYIVYVLHMIELYNV
jgi:hypothetical protein